MVPPTLCQLNVFGRRTGYHKQLTFPVIDLISIFWKNEFLTYIRGYKKQPSAAQKYQNITIIIKMQHYLFTTTVVLLLLGQSWPGATLIIADSLDDDNIEQGSTPDLQPVACHYEDLVIDFEKIGLDFFLRPRKINVGQCVGPCPEVSIIHSHTSTYETLRRLSGRGGESCCVPTEFSSVAASLYYHDPKQNQNTARFELLEDVKVTECGCR